MKKKWAKSMNISKLLVLRGPNKFHPSTALMTFSTRHEKMAKIWIILRTRKVMCCNHSYFATSMHKTIQLMRIEEVVISHICQCTVGFDLETKTERENIEKHVLREKALTINIAFLWTKMRKLQIYQRGSAVVKALCCKPEGRGLKSR
jgi:hypothetical protein